MVRFTDEEYARFLAMYEQSGVYAKAVFVKARVFGAEFRVLKVDKTLVDYYTKLSSLHAQYRAVGVNYNQTVKELKSRFSEKKAMALLYKLEKMTVELAGLSRQILALTHEFQQRWLPNQCRKLPLRGFGVQRGEGERGAGTAASDAQDFRRRHGNIRHTAGCGGLRTLYAAAGANLETRRAYLPESAPRRSPRRCGTGGHSRGVSHTTWLRQPALCRIQARGHRPPPPAYRNAIGGRDGAENRRQFSAPPK